MDGATRRPSARRNPYAVLNLPRTRGGGDDRPIGDEKIREAHKRLSRLLHPDKRPPGREREDAQELFVEMQHAYEILRDPALRQAYDHFGHAAVALVRHNRYAPDSLYGNLSLLHDEGKPSEALEVLRIVLEDSQRKRRHEEWEFNADVQVDMHASPNDSGGVQWPDVSATRASFAASVPLPTQAAAPFPAQDPDNNQPPQQKRKLQLGIGGQSNLEKGVGSAIGTMSLNYQPVPHTSVTSDLAVGQEHLETSVSSSTQLANGTGLSAKLTRAGEGGLTLGLSSHRALSLFRGRTVHAGFALGAGAGLRLRYAVLSMTTWGLRPNADSEKSDAPPPRIAAKLQLGAQFPVQCTVDQSHLFGRPHRSGRATVAWSPLAGYKLKGLLSRTFSRHCGHHRSEFASRVGIGVEHAPLSGLKWLISYEHPEGLTVRIPIFLSSFLSPGYWNRVLWISTLSYLLDETIEEVMGHSSPSAEDGNSDQNLKAISTKIRSNEEECRWMGSSGARENAQRQLDMMAPVAEMKRRREEAISGLVILKATYASTASSSPQVPSKDVSLDVTAQLQFWVESSRLLLPPSKKGLLLGFYDLRARDRLFGEMDRASLSDRWIHTANNWLSRLGVGGGDAPDQRRYHGDESVTLRVRYKYRGQVFEMSVRDRDALQLPCNAATSLGPSHLVS